MLVELACIHRRTSPQSHFVSTTQQPLGELLESGKIRRELYYAIGVLELTIPPLRERPNDVVALLNHFGCIQSRGALQFSNRALQMLKDYCWPGNVTELQNLVTQILVSCRTSVDTEDLSTIWDSLNTPQFDFSELSLAEAETQLVLSALSQCRGNRTAAAKRLGISKRTLHNKIRQYKRIGLIMDSIV